ncbi:phosphoribosylaminoimidazolesuccinocarboxamide synthase [Pelagibacteraceae bacterium]|nr:phosphoribosylaminoimidazolesuccinocarboxamide synthase [Pelagibacteraceae bacterium]
MMRRKKIYEGKAKILYEGPERNTLVQYFKDDATAFNNKKKAVIEGKGVLNNRISEFILNQLNEIGIETHLIKRLNMREQLIKSCEIVPVEFVVRNIAAGTLANRLGMTEGTILRRPIIEYYYKNDDLNDPLVTEEHIEINNWASSMEIAHATETAFRINDFLIGLFRGVGIKLVDFKLEFGRIWKNEDCKIILADEISPDTCRLWDLKDEKKLDKDRFRRDLGGLVEAYTEVAKRLGIMPEGSNIMEIKSGVSKTIKLKKR